LALGVCDRLYLLQYSTYSVISPEGCASILWKSSDKASLAAEAMGITSDRLLKLGLIDGIIKEPLGGAHRDVDAVCASLKKELKKQVEKLQNTPVDQMLKTRYQRLMSYGAYSEE
jgi:acetyl-CoA carboxylase carboxyl transferase subunit alpha